MARLAERGLVERMTDEGDGRSAWWVGRTPAADEALERVRADLRADLTRIAAGLGERERLAGLRALSGVTGSLARHASVQRESRWREMQYRRWQERQRARS